MLGISRRRDIIVPGLSWLFSRVESSRHVLVLGLQAVFNTKVDRCFAQRLVLKLARLDVFLDYVQVLYKLVLVVSTLSERKGSFSCTVRSYYFLPACECVSIRPPGVDFFMLETGTLALSLALLLLLLVHSLQVQFCFIHRSREWRQNIPVTTFKWFS